MPGVSSFTEFLSRTAPELLPGRRPLPPGMATDLAPHATTIVAITCVEGVVMVGDRRATMGNLIANRDIEKVHAADEYSLIGCTRWSWSTTKRSRAPCSRCTARPTGWPP